LPRTEPGSYRRHVDSDALGSQRQDRLVDAAIGIRVEVCGLQLEELTEPRWVEQDRAQDGCFSVEVLLRRKLLHLRLSGQPSGSRRAVSLGRASLRSH